ncbi:hypothetical protein C8R45DRAFT_1027958 [Mycena sanguinolenta]|nr:hypothetical protein C8R45DRAFT_1027958 [Mycena sanguinolenta]
MSFNANIVLGALLVGTWANSILYTVEVTQAVYYYRHFKNDDWKLKLLLSSVITIDSVSMIANYASVYLYTITHWGDLAYLQNQYWFDPLYVFSTGVVAALAQSFLAARYWLLTKNKFITLILFCFIIVAAGGAFASGATLAIYPKYTERGKVTIPATTWLIAEAVTDISVASALLWQFRKAKSSFKETRSLLNRLVARTIRTGSAGATFALAVLIAFLANKESNVPTGIAYVIGRIYCITMLANLNSRKRGKTWSSSSSGANLDTRGNRERSEGVIHVDVHRSAVVHVDTPEEFSTRSFKTNGLPDDTPAAEIEMEVTGSASYSSKKKQDLFAA